jgi:hypothetical protein
VAAALRELHYEGLGHGRVATDTIVLSAAGAELSTHLPYVPVDFTDDIRCFGAILYEMLNGMQPCGPGLTAAVLSDSRTGPSGIRSEANRLALDCLAAPPALRPTMQRVVTQVRLLWLVSRQSALQARAAPPPAAKPTLQPAPSPFLVPVAPVSMAVPTHVMLSPSERVARTGPVPSPPQPPASEPGAASAAGQPAYNPDDFGPLPAGETLALEFRGGACPKCRSTMVYVSRAKSGFERRLERWNVPICRCHRCNHRYVVIANLKIGKEMPVSVEAQAGQANTAGRKP